MKTINIDGVNYPIKKTSKKGKEYVVELANGKKVYFADPDMPEFPGTKRGDNYCARSLGIAKKYDVKGDKSSANFWSRKLWSCEGDKSVSKKKFFGKLN